MKSIVEGTGPRNAARSLANKMGGGGGLGAAVWTIPGAMTALATGDMKAAALAFGVPAAGAAIKAGENYLTKREVNNLSNTIRLRSPRGQQRVEKDKLEREMRGPVQPLPYTTEEAYKMLLAYQLQNPDRL
jgi:hypothetical protein